MSAEQMNMFPMEQMSGGGFEGAERLGRSVATWYAPHGSGDQILLPAKDDVDARHNDVIRNDAFAAGALEKYQDSIVGPNFRLNADPDLVALGKGFDRVWATEFQQEVESKFTLWAESQNYWVDASGINSFTGLLRQAIGPMYLVYGEVLATAEWIRDGRLYNTAIQMIDPARLSNPGNVPETTFFRAGVQKNRWGRPTTYYIRNTHPFDYVNSFQDSRHRQVPAYKPWGRKQVIHIVEQHRIGQTRGVGKMVSSLKEMRMRRKLNEVELQNVVLNAVYAAVLETDLPSDVAMEMVGEGAGDTTTPGYKSMVTNIQTYLGGKSLFLDGVKMPFLPPGSKLNMQRSATTANPQFSFEKSLNRYIARSLGMSYEEFTGDYSETNYSSARAAMGESWKMYQGKRKFVVDRMATDIFSLWLEESISKGRIDSIPAGFGVREFNADFNKEALTRCRWLGAPRPVIDPLKEEMAAGVALSNTTTTLEAECAKRGTDWREVLDQRAREKEYAEERGLTLEYTNAKGSPDAVIPDDDGRPTDKPAKGNADDK